MPADQSLRHCSGPTSIRRLRSTSTIEYNGQLPSNILHYFLQAQGAFALAAMLKKITADMIRATAAASSSPYRLSRRTRV